MPQSHTNSNLMASIPYFKSSASSLKKSLAHYHISTSFHSNTNLKSLLSHTKSTTPPFYVKNIIYKILCGDCNQFYIGQTCCPLKKWIKEHEACFRLNNYTDDSTGNIKSAPTKHGKENGHRINWKSTSIITSSDTKGQLNLLEHAAISLLKPDMNIQHKCPCPSVNSCWNPSSLKSQPPSKTFPLILKFEILLHGMCAIFSWPTSFLQKSSGKG